MSVQLSQGTQIAIAATYGTVKVMSALTNASEAVATLEASHGVIVNDIIEITSGWDRLTDRIARAKTVATNDVTLEGINTTSTTFYPTGTGTGTVREILTWAALSQIQNISAEAPSVDFVDVTTLSDQTRKRIPGLDQAPSMTITLLYDLSLSWVATALAASDANSKVAIRMITPGGQYIYANGYCKLSRFPQVSTGQAITNQMTLTFASTPTSYAS